jgi:hypothetical protein
MAGPVTRSMSETISLDVIVFPLMIALLSL